MIAKIGYDVRMNGMTRIWKSPPPTDPAHNLQDRILEARGITSRSQFEAFLNPTLMDLDDPNELQGTTEAASVLA